MRLGKQFRKGQTLVCVCVCLVGTECVCLCVFGLRRLCVLNTHTRQTALLSYMMYNIYIYIYI